jgi:hypothetical protein
MSDDRPYAERPAARPDPNLIAARNADAAGGAGKPTPGSSGGGCIMVFVAFVVIAMLVVIVGAIAGVFGPPLGG